MLKKQLLDQLDLESICGNQHKRYKIVKNLTISTLIRQKNFLSNMKVFHDLRNLNFDSEIEKKKIKYEKLEYELSNLKSENQEFQKKILAMDDEINEHKVLIEQYDSKNSLLSMDYKAILREFLKSEIRLLNFFKNLKVKSIEEAVYKFNDERLKYQGYYSQYLSMNKTIASFNIKHSKLSHHLDSIRNEIREKKFYLSENFIEYKGTSVIIQNEESFKICSEITASKESNSKLKEKITHQEKFFVSICKFLEFYFKKLSKVNKHIKDILLCDNDKEIDREKRNSSVNINLLIKNHPLVKKLTLGNIENMSIQSNKSLGYNFNSTKNLSYKIDYDALLSFNSDSIKKFLKFFHSVENIFMFLYSTLSANEGMYLFTNEKKFTEGRNSKIIYLFDENILNSTEQIKNSAFKKLENKNKLLNRSEKEIVSRLNLDNHSK